MKHRDLVIVTAALILSNAMGGLATTVVNTALPAIISDLHGIELMGWVVAVFLLGTAITTPLWSKLGEYIGNKRAYMMATAIFALGSLLQGFAPNMVFLIATQTLMGLGSGGMSGLPFIIYADLYSDLDVRARVLGLGTASYSAATIIGPLVGGWIVDTLSWHWVFFMNVPVALLSVALIARFYQEVKQPRTQVHVDIAGATILASGLAVLLVASQLMNSVSLPIVIGLFILAIVLLGLLVWVEGHATDPIMPIRLFRNQRLVIDFLLFVLIWGAFIAFNIYGPMWAQGLLATTAVVGGATQIPSSVTNFFGTELAPNMKKHWQQLTVVMIGIISFLFAFGIMVLAGVDVNFGVLLFCAVFVGFGNGVCFSILQIKVQDDVATADIPVATSFSFLIRMLSQTFMSSIYGVMLTRQLTVGVARSHGQITMGMMNHLTNASSAKSLPTTLLPKMRAVLHTGLHNIMLLALVLLIIAFIVVIIARVCAKRPQQWVRD